jgi:acyl carrier protein
VLSTHPEVRQAVVVAHPDASGALNLAAYVVTTIEPEAMVGRLKTYLREQLPAYMVPSRWVRVDEFPLTSSGKIDRRALPSVDSDGVNGNGAGQKPQSEIERVVAGVWQEVLDLETIGVEDNFFEIGGHSLMAVTVHRRLEEVFEKNFSMVEMFRYPTVGTLADYLRRNGASRPKAKGQQRGEQQKRALEQGHAHARARIRRKSRKTEHGDAG